MLTNRYVLRSTKSIWNETGYFQALFEVMKAVVKAQGELKIIPYDHANKILKQAKYDIKAIKKLESKFRHETYAFISNVTSYLDDDCRQYLHYGLTSSDLLDTALSLKLKRSAEVILNNLTLLQKTLRDLAYRHKDTICVGRTHGMHAEPYSLGLKFALYYAEFKRHIQRLKTEQYNVSIAKVSGALGNYAHVDFELEQMVGKELNLRTTSSNTQIIPRDHVYYFMTVLVGIASTVEKIAVEIRHMQRTEVGEWSESFTSTQKGSSAMPHKCNPILSENLCGLSRVCRSGLSAIAENIILWHERDMSHSSVERLIVPEMIMLLDYMTDKMNNILSNLQINKKTTSDNLLWNNPLIYSQKIMLMLIKKGMARSEAHDLLQRILKCLIDKRVYIYKSKQNLLLKSPKINPEITKYFSPEEIKQATDNDSYLRVTDKMYLEIFDDVEDCDK